MWIQVPFFPPIVKYVRTENHLFSGGVRVSKQQRKTCLSLFDAAVLKPSPCVFFRHFVDM